MGTIILRKIRIEGVWNKYTVDFPLDEDVNILVGDNGIGKTTILNILYSIIRNLFGLYKIDQSYRSAHIEFSDDYSVSVSTDEKGIKNAEWKLNDEIVDYRNVPIKVDVVSSFDSDTFSPSIQEKLRATHEDIESELDMMLYRQVDVFYRYKSMLSLAYRKFVLQNTIDEANKIYEPLDKIQKHCDELFKDKVWYEEETTGSLHFKLKDDDVMLNLSQLSSGEKQMLILLLSTLTQNNIKCITFWDEPEISLHIEWQQSLIRVVRELNPNMQLILATHSPSILYEGWEMRAINVNDIKK